MFVSAITKNVSIKLFFFSSRRRHTRFDCDWSSDVCSSDLGSQLIGKLEGPEVQPDAKRPAKLAEAPMLAELVKAGKLPPVEQRVPEEPLVIKPLREIGTYGGTWRRAFTGPGDGENGNRIMASD